MHSLNRRSELGSNHGLKKRAVFSLLLFVLTRFLEQLCNSNFFVSSLFICIGVSKVILNQRITNFKPASQQNIHLYNSNYGFKNKSKILYLKSSSEPLRITRPLRNWDLGTKFQGRKFTMVTTHSSYIFFLLLFICYL